MKRAMKIFIIICIIAAVVFIVGKRILFPRYEEIKVTGAHEIACEDYWVTQEKEDPFLKAGSLREVQVRAWYPKDYPAQGEKLPVVIASHGSCGSIDNNQSMYREFASHGYVVLAVGHPRHAMEVVHANGKKQSVSMEYLKEVGSIRPQANHAEAAVLFAKWMELRMADLTAVMDDFADRAAGCPDKFCSADTGRFVVMGHSAGGSAALGMARIRTDVVGVIALEAPFMYDIKGVQDGRYVIDETDYEMPILHVYSDASYSHLSEWEQYRNNVKFLESDKENYENIHYAGIGHMGLCDLFLASPILASLPDQQRATVSPSEQLQRLNADCLAFLQSSIGAS